MQAWGVDGIGRGLDPRRAGERDFHFPAVSDAATPSGHLYRLRPEKPAYWGRTAGFGAVPRSNH
jgi:hypothetical protein